MLGLVLGTGRGATGRLLSSSELEPLHFLLEPAGALPLQLLLVLWTLGPLLFQSFAILAAASPPLQLLLSAMILL